MKKIAAIASILVFAPIAVAQTGPDTWSGVPPLPAASNIGGQMVAAGADAVYCAPGNRTNAFMKFSVSTGAWSGAAWIPAMVAGGSSMDAMPGTPFLYLLPGDYYGQKAFLRYDTSSDTWDALEDFPASEGCTAMACAADGRVYAFSRPQNLWRYEPGGTWTALKPPPMDLYPNVSLAWAGGDWIYASRGGWSSAFWAYSISGDAWTPLPDAPFGFSEYASMRPGPAGTLYAIPAGGGIKEFYRYDIATAPAGTWTKVRDLPLQALGGCGIAHPAGSDSLFIAPGNGTSDFWLYSTSANEFRNDIIAPAPAAVLEGAGLAAGSDGETLFLAQGGNSAAFHLYSTVTNSWSAAASLPAPAWTAGLVPDGGDRIFALTDDGAFRRYSISGNRWDAVTAPVDRGVLVHVAPDSIYSFATAAGPAIRASRYSISADTWTTEATYAASSSLLAAVYPGWGDTIFVLRGGGAREFLGYSILGRAWNAQYNPADPPDPVGSVGVSLCSDGGARIYAFLGRAADITPSTDNRFWVYGIGTNSWSNRAAVPRVPSGGAKLAWTGAGPYLYATMGGGVADFKRYCFPDSPPAGGVTGLSQFRSDGTTKIDPGASTEERRVALKAAMPADADGDPYRLVIEIKAVGTEFDGSDLHRGGFTTGATGSVTIDGLARGTQHHWRACAEDTRGHTTAWLCFGKDPDDASEKDFEVLSGLAPVAPAAPAQQEPGGSAAVAAGGMIVNATGFRVTAGVSDPNADETVRLQVQVNPVGQDFNDETSNVFLGAPVASGAAAFVEVTGRVIDISYHWRLRAIDEQGLHSPWTYYNGSSPAVADIRLRTNFAPTIGAMRQSGGRFESLEIGQHIYGEEVVFDVTAADSHGDALVIEVQVAGEGQDYGDVATLRADGTSAHFSVPLGFGQGRWRARATDIFGAASAWTGFGGNNENEADFVLEDRGGSVSTGPCSASGAGLPLLPLLALFLLPRRR